MSTSSNQIAEVQGVCIHPEYEGNFTGEVSVELRDDCAYYTWRIYHIDGTFLGSNSRPVSFNVIPNEENPFEYALNHAIVGINKYRIRRSKAFHVRILEWKK